MAEPERVNVLGVGISPINLDLAVRRIGEWISRKELQYVCVCTVHTVMECRRSESVRQAVNRSGMATPDGMPLVWLARHAGHPNVSRVYGPDLMIAELESSTRSGHRHFLYGGRPEVVHQLATRLSMRFQGAQIIGTLSPPMAPIDELCTPKTAELINRLAPDIVWVGIGTPKQELWMARMRAQLRAPVLIGVGAAFDFHAGAVRQAPRWIQRGGLEWAYRLLQEPRRLWRRYLFDNPRFIWETAMQKVGWRRFDLS